MGAGRRQLQARVRRRLGPNLLPLDSQDIDNLAHLANRLEVVARFDSSSHAQAVLAKRSCEIGGLEGPPILGPNQPAPSLDGGEPNRSGDFEAVVEEAATGDREAGGDG